MWQALFVVAVGLVFALGACEPKPGSPPKPKTTTASVHGHHFVAAQGKNRVHVVHVRKHEIEVFQLVGAA